VFGAGHQFEEKRKGCGLGVVHEIFKNGVEVEKWQDGAQLSISQ